MPYALVGTYPTGRSRVVRFRGTWGGTAQVYSEQTDPQYIAPFGEGGYTKDFFCQVFQPANWDIAIQIHQSDYTGVGEYYCVPQAYLYGGFGADWRPFFTFPGGYRFSVGQVYIPTSDTRFGSVYFIFDFDKSGQGEWYVVIDRADEYFNVYVETDDLGNPVFPNYGGAVTTDTPYSNWIEFFEVIPTGTKVTIGGTYAPWGLAAETYGIAAVPVRINAYEVLGLARPHAQRVNFGPDTLAEAWILPNPADDYYLYPYRREFDSGAEGYGVCDVISLVDTTAGRLTAQARTTTCTPASGRTWAEGAILACPYWRYHLKAKVFAMEGDYPEAARITVRGASGNLTNPLQATPDIDVYDAKRYGVTLAKTYWKIGLAYSNETTGNGIDERSAIGTYMTPSGLLADGEDTADWRMLQRGLAFDSCQVTQDELQLVDDGSALQQDSANQKAGQWSGLAPATVSSDGSVLTITTADLEEPGSATRNFADEGTNGNAWSGADFMGYRWLRLRIRGTSADNQVFTLSLANARDTKTWSLTTGAKDAWTDVYVDLCYPDSESAATDDKDSKWPLSGDSEQGHIDDSAYWGVSEVASLSLTNLGRNQVYELDSITLEARSHQRLNILPVFNQWVMEADDDTDPFIYEARRLLWGDTDGRVSLENPDMRRNVALQDLQTYTITGEINRVNGLLDGRPTSGWEAEAVSELPTDGYHNNDTLDACCLWGQGAFWGKLRGDSEPRWHIGLDIDASE